MVKKKTEGELSGWRKEWGNRIVRDEKKTRKDGRRIVLGGKKTGGELSVAEKKTGGIVRGGKRWERSCPS